METPPLPPETDVAHPARVLPLAYFGLAHLALAAAFVVVGLEPDGLIGFFYHPRMVFVVHLVTLGWITPSILGALYLSPVSRTAGPADYGSFALYLLGGSGVVFHFWIEELSGVALSGILVALAVGQVGLRFLLALGDREAGARARFGLAFANFALAALAGVALAFDKLLPVLPGYALAHVFAHAHLAALGWAAMMVFAMTVPEGAGGGPSVAVFEAGVLGLSAALYLESAWRGAFAVVTVLGIVLFLARTKRTSAQTRVAFAYLAAAAALGLVLVFTPWTEDTLRLAPVYGACGLIGFLAQAAAGLWARFLPGGRLRTVALAFWTIGVPALAAGLWAESPALVGWAAWALLAAAAAGLVHGIPGLVATRA